MNEVQPLVIKLRRGWASRSVRMYLTNLKYAVFPELDEDDQPKLVLKSLHTSLQQASKGKTKPGSKLWDDIDAK